MIVRNTKIGIGNQIQIILGYVRFLLLSVRSIRVNQWLTFYEWYGGGSYTRMPIALALDQSKSRRYVQLSCFMLYDVN